MFSDNAAFGLYAVSATVLALHLITLALLTGTVRVRTKQWVNPEDAKLSKGETFDAEHSTVARVKRAHVNAIENFVPFLVVAALYAATAPGRAAALAYFGTFVVARLLHSVFYIWGRQPFRTLAFAAGVLAIVGMAVHVLRVFA
jgi:uncharacterized MAPEG superfamily protein